VNRQRPYVVFDAAQEITAPGIRYALRDGVNGSILDFEWPLSGTVTAKPELGSARSIGFKWGKKN
jgi:hypothetical protein